MSKKGRQGDVEAPKQETKTKGERSKHTGARGSQKVPLTDLQKVLIGNGGIGHVVLRRKKMDLRAPKRRRRDDA